MPNFFSTCLVIKSSRREIVHECTQTKELNRLTHDLFLSMINEIFKNNVKCRLGLVIYTLLLLWRSNLPIFVLSSYAEKMCCCFSSLSFLSFHFSFESTSNMTNVVRHHPPSSPLTLVCASALLISLVNNALSPFLSRLLGRATSHERKYSLMHTHTCNLNLNAQIIPFRHRVALVMQLL